MSTGRWGESVTASMAGKSQKRQDLRDHHTGEKASPQGMAGKRELPHLIWRSTTAASAPSLASYAMLSYAMLCYAMLYYAMLRYAKLCYAKLSLGVVRHLTLTLRNHLVENLTIADSSACLALRRSLWTSNSYAISASQFQQ